MGSSKGAVPGFSLKDTVKIMPMIECCGFARGIVTGVQSLCDGYLEDQKEVNIQLLKQKISTKLKKFFDIKKEVYGHVLNDIKYSLKIEGGQNYNLYYKPDSTLKDFSLDVFKFSICVKLKGYCCYYTRSLVFHIFEREIVIENFITLVYEKVLEELKDGVELCKVYEAVRLFAENENPRLAKHLQKELGFQVGFNLHHEPLAINSHTKAIAQVGMFFAVTINLIDIKEKEVTYSLYFCDTVVIRKGQLAFALTAFPETAAEIDHQVCRNLGIIDSNRMGAETNL